MILSILLVIMLGILANTLFERMKLPGMLGVVGAGVAIGPFGFGLLDGSILANAGDIRMIALAVILLRAGLGLRAAPHAGRNLRDQAECSPLPAEGVRDSWRSRIGC